MVGRSGATSIGWAICHGPHVSIAATGEIFSMTNGRRGGKVGRANCRSHTYTMHNVRRSVPYRGTERSWGFDGSALRASSPRARFPAAVLSLPRNSVRINFLGCDHCTPTHRYQARGREKEKERNGLSSCVRIFASIGKIVGRHNVECHARFDPLHPSLGENETEMEIDLILHWQLCSAMLSSWWKDGRLQVKNCEVRMNVGITGVYCSSEIPRCQNAKNRRKFDLFIRASVQIERTGNGQTRTELD